MQIPSLVLHEALLGVCSDPKEFLSSRRFRKAVHAEQQKQRPRSSRSRFERKSLCLGHLEFGAHVNPYSDFSSVESSVTLQKPSPYDPADRAVFHLFGEQLIIAAGLALPLAFIEKAKRYPRMNAVEQQCTLTDLNTLLLDNCAESVESDMCNQPKDRVLPKYYKDWKHKSVGPNCLGKSQLVAGFLTLAGARAYSVVPFQSTCEYVTLLLSELADHLLAVISGYAELLGVFCAEQYHATIDALGCMRAAKIIRRRPSYPHLAVVTQLVDGTWVMVDPNADLCEKLPDGFDMPKLSSALDLVNQFLPGMTLSARSEHLDEALQIESRKKVVSEIVSFGTHLVGNRFRVNRLVALMEKSGFIDTLRKVSDEYFSYLSKEQQDEIKKRRLVDRPYTARESALQLLLFHSRRLGETTEECLSRAFNNTFQEILNPDISTRTLPKAVYHTLNIAMKAADRCAHSLYSTVQPEIELGALSYQLGYHTLRHVGVDLHLETETNAASMDHVFGQYLLQDALLTKVRTAAWQELNPRAERAAAILGALPYRLRSATTVLQNERIG